MPYTKFSSWKKKRKKLTKKSSNGLHLMVCTGNMWREAKSTVLLSFKLSSVTEWSLATLQKKRMNMNFLSLSKHFFPWKYPQPYTIVVVRNEINFYENFVKSISLKFREINFTKISWKYLQMQCWIRGLHEAGGTYKLVISPAWAQNRCRHCPV